MEGGGRLVVTPKMCRLFDSYVGKHQILKQIGKFQWVNIGTAQNRNQESFSYSNVGFESQIKICKLGCERKL